MRTLIIVESPAKARTLGNFLSERSRRVAGLKKAANLGVQQPPDCRYLEDYEPEE
jgi:reverse gyrase